MSVSKQEISSCCEFCNRDGRLPLLPGCANVRVHNSSPDADLPARKDRPQKMLPVPGAWLQHSFMGASWPLPAHLLPQHKPDTAGEQLSQGKPCTMDHQGRRVRIERGKPCGSGQDGRPTASCSRQGLGGQAGLERAGPIPRGRLLRVRHDGDAAGQPDVLRSNIRSHGPHRPKPLSKKENNGLLVEDIGCFNLLTTQTSEA